jgi:O-antigen ligase
MLLLAPPVFWQRLSSLGGLSTDYNMTSDGGRIQIWKRGMATLAAHPIVGVGGGQFAASDGMAATREGSDDRSWHTAHNSVLQIAVELGVVGLIGFLGLHLPTLRAARRARLLSRAGILDPAVATVGEALFLSIVGFYVGGMFLSAADSYASFTLGALGMAFTAMLRTGVGMVAAPAAAVAQPVSGWRSARAVRVASRSVA